MQEDWGVRPDQVVDFQALVGDPVDNVPGVALIGPKAARELLERYDTLEGIFEHASEVSGQRKRENLIAGARTGAAEPATGAARCARADRIGLAAGRSTAASILRRCSLSARSLVFTASPINCASAPQVVVAPPRPAANYRTIDTPEKFAEFLARLSNQKIFSFDLETTSIAPTQADIVGYAFSWAAGEADYLPVRAPREKPDSTRRRRSRAAADLGKP